MKFILNRTYPARVLDALGVGPGDRPELDEGPDGFILRPRRVDPSRLGTLNGKIPPGIRRSISRHSAANVMTRRFGIDTSTLLRLIMGDPEAGYRYCVRRISSLMDEGCEVFAPNRAIGEAYVAVRHHYGISKADARSALHAALRSGLVAPLNGRTAIAAPEASDGGGPARPPHRGRLCAGGAGDADAGPQDGPPRRYAPPVARTARRGTPLPLVISPVASMAAFTKHLTTDSHEIMFVS